VVTVVDNTNPTITAPAAITVNANSSCTATGVALGSPVVTDNCAGSITTNNAPTIFPLGNTIVIWTVTDLAGHTATAAQSVTVVDVTLPTITAPSNITVSANTNCVAFNLNLGTPIVSDNCSIASVVNNGTAVYALGTTTVTWTVTDGSGNIRTATQTVTVVDNSNPIITAPAPKTVNANAGCTATGVNLGSPVASDNCSAVVITNNAPTAFPIGNTTVTWTATDNAGNIATATQIVTVLDNTNPTITAPSAVTVNANSTCTATGVVLGTPIASDNCTSIVTSNNAPTAFPLGQTIVTWTVTDLAGNIATAAQSVTVVDNQNPTIFAPAAVNANTNNSCMALNVNLGTPLTSDNCSVATLVNNAPSAFNVGTTVVTWTVTDGSGLTATATQNVIVSDIEDPIIIAPPNINANTTSACSANGINLGTATAFDNCSVATIVSNAPASFPVGTTFVVWTATDVNGNTSTATQTVVINDVVNPTITAPSDITTVTNSGCTASGIVIGVPQTADNCGVASVSNDAPVSFPVGITSITWTVTDVNGNTAIAIQKVTVTDNMMPTLTVSANITVDANNSCVAFNVNLGSPLVSDNCGIATLLNDAPTVYNIGTTTVTWIATDNNGNSISATQTVTVVDNTVPVIIAPANMQVSTNNNCVASGLNLGNPIATDNCTIASLVNDAPLDFPVGITTVTYTVTDAAGNVATSTQTITVSDIVNPTALLQNILVTLDGQGAATVSFADIDTGSSDNCGIASTNLSQTDFDCSDIGVNNVTVIITDNNDNTTISTVTVTVKTNGIDSDNDGIDDSCDDIADPIEPEIPEAFTPNGNNINEYFVIGNLETFEQRELNVYNRYGNSVYSSVNYQNDWDGTRSDNGQALPDATYYYVLKLSENDIRKGFVYINRVRQ
jgi:gliding motility-associated-like protein